MQLARIIRSIKLSFVWYDVWVGLYYDRVSKTIYFCPFPMIVFSYQKRNMRNYISNWNNPEIKEPEQELHPHVEECACSLCLGETL